jgi:4-amino-4-deoxy-L-arabinose transferase-like glycosyltransferase
MPSTHTPRHLALILCLLFVGFFLHIHLLTGFPAYIDEYRHIARAQTVFTSAQNPVEFSHGKLLLYYWLGLFQPEGTNALFVSRAAVALSLVAGSTAVAGIARILFGSRAAVPALVVFTFAPYALFYQRLALADSFAGVLVALAVWLILRATRHPTRGAGIALGTVLALATLAKLTAAPALVLPLIAIILSDSTARNLDYRLLWKRYHACLIAAGAAFVALWAIVGVATLADVLADGTPLLLDKYLLSVDATIAPDSLSDKLKQLGEALALLLSAPALVLLSLLLAFGFWKSLRAMLFALAWLAMLWGPSIVLGDFFESRYLMIGMPALAVVVGGACAAFEVGLGSVRYHFPTRVAAAGLALWAAVFALPRAWTIITQPQAADITEHDAYLYFASPASAWGISEALDYLSQDDTHDPASIPVTALLAAENGVTEYCGLAELYVPNSVRWSCMSQIDFEAETIPASVSQWPQVTTALKNAPYTYVLTNVLPEDAPPLDARTHWELVLAPERPYGGPKMLLWRVSSVASNVVGDLPGES